MTISIRSRSKKGQRLALSSPVRLDFSVLRDETPQRSMGDESPEIREKVVRQIPIISPGGSDDVVAWKTFLSRHVSQS